MTPEQVVLVKNSWAMLTLNADQTAKVYYGKVAELDPSLLSLFTGDEIEKGHKLMHMIDTAVNSLDRLEATVPAVDDLGERHSHYGVKNQDYDILSAALLLTLECELGEEFTAKIKEAWTITYSELARAMKVAASSARQQQDLSVTSLGFA